MLLRRFEFGIASSTGDTVQVYARRGDGTRFVKTFEGGPDVLERAEADLLAAPRTWQKIPGHVDMPGLSKVWAGEGALYISGEAAVTPETLAEARIQRIVSTSQVKPETRNAIAAYLAEKRDVRHIHAPILDILARHQTDASAKNARIAVDSTVAGLQRGENVLVHCLMGIHRSVAVGAVALTLCGAFASPQEAFLHIRERRHIAGRNTESFDWLHRLVAPREVA